MHTAEKRHFPETKSRFDDLDYRLRSWNTNNNNNG